MTRLATPQGFRVRLVVGPVRTRAVVTGVFPPEDAARYRPTADAFAAIATRRFAPVIERVQQDMIRAFLDGSSPFTPRGLLS